MPTQVFISLPTSDLDRAKKFYAGVGWTINPATALQTQTGLSVDSREEVDAIIAKVVAAGGAKTAKPRTTGSCILATSKTRTETTSASCGWTPSPQRSVRKHSWRNRDRVTESMTARSYGQYCGVATAVDIIGERWALLIVRDLLVGARRYSDLKEGLPRIPTNILSSRLKELQAAGIVRRVPLAHLPPTIYEAHVEDFALRLHVNRTQLSVARLDKTVITAPIARLPLLSFQSGLGLHKLFSGEHSAADAIKLNEVRILTGDRQLLDRFAHTFHLAPAA